LQTAQSRCYLAAYTGGDGSGGGRLCTRETVNAVPAAFKAEGQESNTRGVPCINATLSANHARAEIDPERPRVERAWACEIVTGEKLANGSSGHEPMSQAVVGSSIIHSAELKAALTTRVLCTNDQCAVSSTSLRVTS
jgi:hypothetical protein